MNLVLYAHPFSSYCQKALIALYENDIPFTFRMLSQEHPDIMEAFEALWPIKRFPMLQDGDRTIMEATIIIEYLGLHYPGPVKLLPDDPAAAIEIRMLDRFFDNYVMTPQGKLTFNLIRAPEDRDPIGAQEAHAMLEKAYAWLEQHIAGREWAAGDSFTMADCAAGPALFYADWSHPMGDRFPLVKAYRERLNARPSFARAIDDARPYRAFFPGGAPVQD